MPDDPILRQALERAAAKKKAKQGNKPPSIIGGIFSAVFSKESGMGKYNKLIGGLIGYVVGFAISWAVAKGFGSCTIPTDTNTCTVAGMSSADISNIILGILTLAGVYVAPPNKPPA